MGIMVNINNFMALKIYILIGYSRNAAVFRQRFYQVNDETVMKV